MQPDDPAGDTATDRAIEAQRRYYELRAPDYLTDAPSNRLPNRPERGIPTEPRRAIVDEDDRAVSRDQVRHVDGVPVARRVLADGRTFDVVKVFWNADELAARLRSIGWDVAVRRVDGDYLSGVGSPARHVSSSGPRDAGG